MLRRISSILSLFKRYKSLGEHLVNRQYYHALLICSVLSNSLSRTRDSKIGLLDLQSGDIGIYTEIIQHHILIALTGSESWRSRLHAIIGADVETRRRLLGTGPGQPAA